MNFKIITIFPKIFDSYFSESIIKRAQKQGIIKIISQNLREFSGDRRETVDDTPYGGGAGMLMKIEPLYKALKKLAPRVNKKRKIVLLSAQGQRWTQQLAQKYSKLNEVIFICGRYEGVDERIKNFIDDEISIGDYVLTGGELGAMVMIDSITRLLPGALGNEQSSQDESHSQVGILEYPQYTKPEKFKIKNKSYDVPEILLSGNHQKIKEWQEKNNNNNKKGVV
ncbi:tRNA (guanosine(37)-N1)-methyltransferase TrmD [Candidatus Falkowbacteria bacterium CG23_combo_of_CG06-09_8_20_14_all_41_10]|uniref:tRNA (guanine-N(1)-)-methyltransferase n=2 Tax=Candidatus Falkowiibacteriota TaxID=1752728 RepID=A0A2G9ZRC8_9BACT|nr:MAG: tRNA (guanosine(37)-N1)-methyltransferase TrmD [Candidatus Falkowbacteria bacterium CG1_02_41_21]PIP34908.1 MAG: tRNA (guanosine(37)-N1)-methyltransferase TrmD [Candidatus Falkowbacteria bacterium CG23_combo_of_CG06-09_8_20_14_all_41_10]